MSWIKKFPELVLLRGFLAALAVGLSATWLFQYLRVVGPHAMDYLPEGDFSFLNFPVIKVYRIADVNGNLSPRRLDCFNMADGPTGIEYTQWSFPSWPVSLLALGVFLGGCWYLCAGFDKQPHRHERP